MTDKVLENKIYNVRPGDTLLQIATLTGVAYADLIQMNPQISNPNLIYPGDTLVLPGSVSRQKLIVDASIAAYPGDEPKWLKIARHEIGVAEKNPGNNPRILEYLATTTLSEADKSKDETPWCSAFTNWVIRMAGMKGTDSAWALDWRNWGKALGDGKLGAIAVFSRKRTNESGGHVGFWLGETSSQIRLLSGNSSNSVNIANYPKNGKKGSYKYELKAYRWPS